MTAIEEQWITRLENRFNAVSDKLKALQAEEAEILEELCKARTKKR